MLKQLATGSPKHFLGPLLFPSVQPDSKGVHAWRGCKGILKSIEAQTTLRICVEFGYTSTNISP